MSFPEQLIALLHVGVMITTHSHKCIIRSRIGQWTGRAADGGTMAVRLALASGCTAMNDTGCVVNLFDMETHR